MQTQSLPTTQFYDPLRQLLNVTGSWSDIISRAHIDPVPNNLILALTELPFGPQLDAAVKNLPVITVRPLQTLPLTTLQSLLPCRLLAMQTVHFGIIAWSKHAADSISSCCLLKVTDSNL